MFRFRGGGTKVVAYGDVSPSKLIHDPEISAHFDKPIILTFCLKEKKTRQNQQLIKNISFLFKGLRVQIVVKNQQFSPVCCPFKVHPEKDAKILYF